MNLPGFYSKFVESMFPKGNAITTTILEQMSLGDRRKSMVMSWAFDNPTIVEEQLGGVEFQVTAHKFTGTIKIVLTGADLYDVTLTTKVGGAITTFEGLYCDNFVEVIDEYIEKQDEYEY